MKLLEAVLPRVQRLVPSADRGTAIALVCLLGGLEFVGRRGTSDLHDLLAGIALLLGVMFIGAWHRTQPVGWVHRLSQYARRQAHRFDRLKYDVGIDFRGEPRIPPRIPRTVYFVFLGLFVWSGLALSVWHFFPNGWRDIGLRTSYVLYLVVIVSLWLMLSATIAACVWLPVYVFDNHMRRNHEREELVLGEHTPQTPDPVVLLGYFFFAALVTLITPPMYGLGLCLVVACLCALTSGYYTGGDANLLWRSGSRKRSQIFSVPIRRVLAMGTLFIALLIAMLIVSASGGRLMAPPSLEAPMVVTGFLGALAAWLVPGLVLLGLYQLLRFHKIDPTRRESATIRIDNLAQESLGVRASAIIRSWGLRTVFAPAPDKGTPLVGVRLVSPEKSEATEFDPRWPLKVSLPDLEAGAVKDRLIRRDEIQLRRRFLKSLSKLLKQSSQLVPDAGGGFWIAPQWWFVETLLWEPPARGKEAEEGVALRAVGPTYDKLLGPRIRQHLHEILRATQVDLIYLEDGVSGRKLVTVLRQLFELYDVHGGKRRAEDHHFRGIPKIRVVIHDYAPGNEFKLSNYPEPKFDDVSRFRVLHVFRDRGESEELTESPFDFSWEPSPMMVR
jgi:hypothetical protein